MPWVTISGHPVLIGSDDKVDSRGMSQHAKDWVHAWTWGKKGTAPGTDKSVLTPSAQVSKDLASARPKSPTILYRAHLEGTDSAPHESWTPSKEMAESLASAENRPGEPHRVVLTRRVDPSEMVYSSDHLPGGADHNGAIDSEVVVANGKAAQRLADIRGEKLNRGSQWSGKWSSIGKYGRKVD